MTTLKALLVIAGCSPAVFAGGKVMNWTVDGVKRQAIVYAPASPSGKTPVVLSFHGHGDNMQNFQTVDLQDSWRDAIVVYPQGLPTSRPGQPGLPGWQTETDTYQDRDLKLVDTILAALHQQYSIDDNRVYATGFSNGAIFTYLLWAERPNVFAAFAPVAARLGASVTLTVPKPVLHIVGRDDYTIPFETQKRAIEAARQVDQVSNKGENCGINCTLYKSANGSPVMTIVHPGGHEYPDGTSETIVKFFKAHPRQ